MWYLISTLSNHAEMTFNIFTTVKIELVIMRFVYIEIKIYNYFSLKRLLKRLKHRYSR